MKVLQILPMYHSEGEKVLRESAEVIQTNNYEPEHIKRLLTDVDGIVLRAPAYINADILDAATNVKVISGAGIGLDNIDVAYATKKGIPILYAPKVNVDSTAEHALALLFSLTKKLTSFHREMVQGNFQHRDVLFPSELKGKRVGLIGFGSIAQKVAKVCSKGLEMNVMSYVRSIDEEKERIANDLEVTLSLDIQEVMKTSDIISVHLPLTNHTRQLIGFELLSLMKPTAYLINTARGGVVDEAALIKVLEGKAIAGAGLDVFAHEPPPRDHSFYQLDNVLLTPHIGGVTEESAEKMSTIVAQNLIAALNGEKPPFLGNPEVYK